MIIVRMLLYNSNIFEIDEPVNYQYSNFDLEEHDSHNYFVTPAGRTTRNKQQPAYLKDYHVTINTTKTRKTA